eukprot:Skav221403  [mRNA]  locus=scaffold1352:67100:76744:+ [translate_table: standard]
MAPLLSRSPGAIGGKATGVGLLSHVPARALSNDWPTPLWNSGRIQVCAALVGQAWIKVGIGYGYALNPLSVETQEKTDELLACLTSRIIDQSCGYRVIMGDFNHSAMSLPQFDKMRAAGFVEIQELAQQKWMRPPQPTYRDTSIIDMMWLSPELCELLTEVVVDPSYVADHAVLYGKFRGLGKAAPTPIWRKPLVLPWDQVNRDTLCAPDLPPDNERDPIQTIFGKVERAIDQQLRDKGTQGLLPQQFGRCLTLTPTWKCHAVTPLRKARPHDVQVQYQGEHFQHVQWCRQLRRLQSYVRLSHHVHDHEPTPVHQEQLKALWASIRGAKGFPHGFPQAWMHRSLCTPGSPKLLPRKPPPYEVVMLIFCDFQAEFKTLEKLLQQKRLQGARERRFLDSNVVFQDVKRARSLQAQTLVTKEGNDEVEVPAATIEPWQLFVDGACQHPKEPVLRLGTWGVVCADLSSDTFSAVASGLLPGMLHTALRAEIYAAWVAVRTALSANHKFMLWTDNQVVYDRIWGWLHFHGKTIGPSSKDCDLWQPLRQAVKAAHRRCLFLHVIKVRSHENAAAYTDHLEQWVIRGNAAADHLAEQAVGFIPHDVLLAACADAQQGQPALAMPAPVGNAMILRHLEGKAARHAVKAGASPRRPRRARDRPDAPGDERVRGRGDHDWGDG